MNYVISFSRALLLAIISVVILSCNSPKVINDLGNKSYSLVNQDSSKVQFPGDFKGDILVVGFIYTHCPDVCPVITAKLSNIHNQLENPESVHFAEITFDPRRDTPSILKKYMKSFNLDSTKFTLLTGDSLTIDSVLNNMDITAKISYRKTRGTKDQSYLMNHTNRILVMDRIGRVRFEYPGSVVPEKNVIEDINKLL